MTQHTAICNGMDHTDVHRTRESATDAITTWKTFSRFELPHTIGLSIVLHIIHTVMTFIVVDI
jgi:hypothetical protein